MVMTQITVHQILFEHAEFVDEYRGIVVVSVCYEGVIGIVLNALQSYVPQGVTVIVISDWRIENRDPLVLRLLLEEIGHVRPIVDDKHTPRWVGLTQETLYETF
jgi:hypothetical protein